MYSDARVRPKALAILRVETPSRTSLRIVAQSWRVLGEPCLLGGKVRSSGNFAFAFPIEHGIELFVRAPLFMRTCKGKGGVSFRNNFGIRRTGTVDFPRMTFVSQLIVPEEAKTSYLGAPNTFPRFYSPLVPVTVHRNR